MVKCDAAAACPARVDRNAEALNDVGSSIARGVLQRDEKTARRRRRIGKVAAAPGVGVDRAVRRRDKVAEMAEIVRKYRGAKTRRKGEAAVVALARWFRAGASARIALAPAVIRTIAARTAKEGATNKLTPSQTLPGICIIGSYCSSRVRLRYDGTSLRPRLFAAEVHQGFATSGEGANAYNILLVTALCTVGELVCSP